MSQVHFESVLNELPALISENDLHILRYCLELEMILKNYIKWNISSFNTFHTVIKNIFF